MSGRALALSVLVLSLTAGAVPADLRGQEVRLPLDRYEDLLQRAQPEPEPEPPPPVPVAFEAARLSIVVGAAGPDADGHADAHRGARLVQTLELFLSGDEWQTLELPSAGTILEADLGDLEGFLESGRAPRLRVRGSGRHRIRLVTAVPVERDRSVTRDTRRLSFALPAAAVVSGTLTAPPDIEEVKADAGALFTREGDGWSFSAIPGGTLSLTLLGTARAPSREGRPLRYEATSSNTLRVTRTRTYLDGWIQARVLDGRIETLSVPLPRGWDLVAVDTTPAATWKTEGGRLRIEPLQPVERGLLIHVRLTRAPESAVVALFLEPEGSARSRFFSKVHVEGDGLAQLEDPASASYLGEPPKDLPVAFLDAPGSLMRVSSAERPPRWRIDWSERAEVLAVEVRRLLVDVLVGETGQAFYQLWLEARSSGVLRLSLTPPPGFRVVVGGRDGSSVIPAADGEDLALPLSSSRETQVLYLAGLVSLGPPENDPFRVPLPSLSAPAQRVEVRVLLPGDHRYELSDATRQGIVSPPPRTEVVVSKSNLSTQVSRIVSVPGSLGERLVPAPPGFAIVQAVWSALSSELSPLVLEIDDRKIRKEWF
jgi:hypothetical protein